MSETYLFIESREFTKSVKDRFGTDEAYASFQSELASQPDKGKVISGATPLRKLRWEDRRRGAGKRGGNRVIYVHIPDLRVLFLLDCYGKDESDDLTQDDKETLQKLGKQLIHELRLRQKRGML